MSFSRDIQEKISQFAKEQSDFYLDDAEMTYMEKLRRKSDRTKEKINAKLAKLKNNSAQSREAQDDMILYMSDYMDDLMSQGLSEQEAFEKASEELSFASKTSQSVSLQDRFMKYYETQDLAVMEAVGLYYGAGVIIGTILGAVAGLLLGATLFTAVSFWIPIVVGAVIGGGLGVGFGMIMNASLVRKNNK